MSILLLILVPFLVLWGGFCFKVSWNMLVPPLFGIMELGILQAIVITHFWGYCNSGVFVALGQCAQQDKFADEDEKSAYRLTMYILFPPLMLFVSWILSLFIQEAKMSYGITHKYWSCSRKVRYGREKTADNAAREMAKKLSKPFASYRCKYCDGYHIAHKKHWWQMCIPKFFITIERDENQD